MNKQITHSYEGMIQDVTKSKYSNKFYFEGKNIRIISTDTQSTGSITNEKGNSLILSIPSPVIDYNLKKIYYNDKTLDYNNSEILNIDTVGTQYIIGSCVTRDYVILITTNNNGCDCIWKVNFLDYDLTLLYLRDLNFSTENPIQILNNFENEKIDKIYFIDGNSQIKVLNLNHSLINKDLEELIDIPKSTIQIVSDYTSSQPEILRIEKGGIHTSGMIQYAYNLYRLNSSQTKLSPLSKLVSLDKEILGGGLINETVSSVPIVNIKNIDDNFTHIKVYSIKYNSLNEIPIISLIKDLEIPFGNNLEVFDDGKIINTISLEEFVFLGSNIIIPKHINSKFNRLFLANYREANCNIELDTRAYSFNALNQSKIYSDLFLNSNVPDGNLNFTITEDLDYDNPILNKFDSVNLDYNNYKFQKDGVTLGGEGKYLKYELTKELSNNNNRFFKDDEIYRIGIYFYNKYSQNSLPSWIADFKARPGNLSGLYNSLKVELKPEFFNWLNNYIFQSEYDIPVGYKILIAERTINDRTIVASGMISGMMLNDRSGTDQYDYNYKVGKARELSKFPNFLLRNCNTTNSNKNCGNTRPLRKNINLDDLNRKDSSPDTEVQRAYYGDKDTRGRFFQYNNMFQLYSPEILFNDNYNLTNNLKIKVKGAFKNNLNAAWGKTISTIDESTESEYKLINAISPYFGGTAIGGNGNTGLFNRGLVSYPPANSANRLNRILFYREYGKEKTIVNGQFYPNTIPFNQPLNPYSNIDPVQYVILKNGNKQCDVLLDNTYSKSNIKYEIIPEPGYELETYSIKITSDISGITVLENINLVTGTNIIDYNNTFSSSVSIPTNTSNYYLVVDSLNEFKFKVNLTVLIEDTSSTISLQKESLLNLYSINESISINENFEEAQYNINEVYGTPEITEIGQDFKSYNNDSKYRYSNSLKGVVTDGDSSWDDDGDYGRSIVSVNSFNNKCITIVAGNDSSSTDFLDRPSIENLFTDSGITGDNNGLILELVKSDIEIYLGNIYGGNTWEDKLKTNYIEIGDYKKINSSDISSINYIVSPGDTFVNNFKFERILKTEENITRQGIFQMCEIVNYLTETTVDLSNRSDLSLSNWDIKFQPEDKDYHIYNTVYSQLSNLIKYRGLNYNVKKIDNFDTNIISSKLKSSGEIIDNWTDLLINETMTLDGKYGPINSLVNFNDEIYSIQDKAFAYISISPRIQTQSSDGISIQLGTGEILDRYKYLSTELGTKNKWSVINSNTGIYFFDYINKSINIFDGNVSKLSDEKLLHSFFFKNLKNINLQLDNPILKKGVSSGFDYINNEIFMTFHQEEKSFTISYNENKKNFISLYDYIPSMYISKGDFFITTNPDNNSIYRQYDGEYNTFYGIKYPSYVILNVNPEPNNDCVFDNINFKSDVTLEDLDLVDKTITHIQAYNDYQNSSLIQLTVGRNNNLRRKFRDWNALIPREGRNRIRAPYIKLKLQFDNQSNYKMVLHDISVFYTTA